MLFLLLFCARFLAGHSRASGACSPGQGLLLFARGAKKLRFIVLFLGGTANPEGGLAEAEARSAASAQASFPARRAREKAASEKEKRTREKSKSGSKRSRLPFIDQNRAREVLTVIFQTRNRLPEVLTSWPRGAEGTEAFFLRGPGGA